MFGETIDTSDSQQDRSNWERHGQHDSTRLKHDSQCEQLPNPCVRQEGGPGMQTPVTEPIQVYPVKCRVKELPSPGLIWYGEMYLSANLKGPQVKKRDGGWLLTPLSEETPAFTEQPDGIFQRTSELLGPSSSSPQLARVDLS